MVMARILVVEDNTNTSEAIRILLEKRGHSVSTAANKQTAIQLAEAENYDLLISDIKLGDGTGHELLAALNARKPIKAIAVSGFVTPEDKAECMAAGFSRFLSKPFDFAALFATINEVLEEKA
jgi:CheY-like chemotaxis protein